MNNIHIHNESNKVLDVDYPNICVYWLPFHNIVKRLVCTKKIRFCKTHIGSAL
jgi:hypothetical protein